MYTIVAPDIDYCQETIKGKKGTQLARVKVVCIFNPLLSWATRSRSLTSMGWRYSSCMSTRTEIRTQIEVMKTEVMKYQTLADSIKSFEERKDSKGKDTFDLSDWWKSNCATLPGFTSVLRAVLTNSLSHPTLAHQSVWFSIFNTTYKDDQKTSHYDYIEISIQS